MYVGFIACKGGLHPNFPNPLLIIVDCSQRMKLQMKAIYIIPAKPLYNHEILSVHFNHILLHGDLQQTNQGLSCANFNTSISMWTNIFYAPTKV